MLSLCLYQHYILIILASAIILHPLLCFVFFILRLIGSQDSSICRGPLKDSSPSSCSEQGQLWGQSRLFRALFRWVLRLYSDGFWDTQTSKAAQALCAVWFSADLSSLQFISVLLASRAGCRTGCSISGRVWWLFNKAVWSLPSVCWLCSR